MNKPLRTYTRAPKSSFLSFFARINDSRAKELALSWGTQPETGRLVMSRDEWKRGLEKGAVILDVDSEYAAAQNSDEERERISRQVGELLGKG